MSAVRRILFRRHKSGIGVVYELRVHIDLVLDGCLFSPDCQATRDQIPTLEKT
jgi:hypothetical protein